MLLVYFALCAISLGLAAKKKPPETPINLNTATSEELQLVPGIGPVTAEKILQMRKSYGAFKSVDDLRAVRGIGPKRLEKMRKYLTIGKATTATKPAKCAQACNSAKTLRRCRRPAWSTAIVCGLADAEPRSRFLASFGMTSPELAALRNRDQST